MMRRAGWRGRRAERRGALRGALFAVGLAALAWLLGLFWFVGQIPSREASAGEATDAIVVLTGGTGRLESGLDLLTRSKGQKLFVSGVYQGVDVKALLQIAQQSPSELEENITLGYRADDTAGNAMETAEWMKENGFSSLRLVTATYHIPRSLLEFRAVMPDIVIVPSPVFPERFKLRNWILWPGSATLIVSEYNKYLFALLRRGIRRAASGLRRS